MDTYEHSSRGASRRQSTATAGPSQYSGSMQRSSSEQVPEGHANLVKRRRTDGSQQQAALVPPNDDLPGLPPGVQRPSLKVGPCTQGCRRAVVANTCPNWFTQLSSGWPAWAAELKAQCPLSPCCCPAGVH